MANILFLHGTMNQLTMQHKVAKQLNEHACFFSPYYFEQDRIMGTLMRSGLVPYLLSARTLHAFAAYCAAHDLEVDVGATKRSYDLVVLGIDHFIPSNFRGPTTRKVLIQEGLIWPEGVRHGIARSRVLPKWIANSNAMGLSHDYDAFCVASEGYRRFFAQRGRPQNKMIVTGLPNFDRIKKDALCLQFDSRDYLLVCTHSHREDFEAEDRLSLLKSAAQFAGERKVIVKLHPRENWKRASREVSDILPFASLYTTGSAEALVAHCGAFVTTFSTTLFNAFVLEKPILHCWLPLDRIAEIAPIQNECADINVAQVCRDVLML